jgi:hypothetical protein
MLKRPTEREERRRVAFIEKLLEWIEKMQKGFGNLQLGLFIRPRKGNAKS